MFAILVLVIIGIIIYYQFIPKNETSSSYPHSSRWISDEEIETEIDFNKMKINLTIEISDTNKRNSINRIMIIPVGYTGSMEPVMFGGNQLLALKITNKDLITPGDIIGFNAENKTIVHRVIEKSYEYHDKRYEPVFRTKGDNCTRMDPWVVKPGDIEGVVIGVLY